MESRTLHNFEAVMILNFTKKENCNHKVIEMLLKRTDDVAYVGPELSRNIRPSSSAFCIACHHSYHRLQMRTTRLMIVVQGYIHKLPYTISASYYSRGSLLRAFDHCGTTSGKEDSNHQIKGSPFPVP